MKPFVINLWFDNQAEEAAKFYTSIFDGKIGQIERYGKEGFEFHQRPEGSVMTVEFEINGMRFIALNGGPVFKLNEAFSVMVYCENQEQIDKYWDKLIEGGEGQQCGWLKDKFGVSWQIVPTLMDKVQKEGTPAEKSRVMAEMFNHVKFDIAKLEKAYRGDGKQPTAGT